MAPSKIAVATLVVATAFLFHVLQAGPTESESAVKTVEVVQYVFDPTFAPLGEYFEGPETTLTEEHLAWRDTICAYETRGMAVSQRDDAVSPKNALGRCQVLPETARRFLGFKGPTYAMFFPRVSEELASRMVLLCLSRRRWSKTLHAVSYCYHGGHRRRYSRKNLSYRYALGVEAMHVLRTRALAGGCRNTRQETTCKTSS